MSDLNLTMGVNWVRFLERRCKLVEVAWTLELGKSAVELVLIQATERDSLNLKGHSRTFLADYFYDSDEPFEFETEAGPTFPMANIDSVLARSAPDPLALTFVLDDFRSHVYEWSVKLEALVAAWNKEGQSTILVNDIHWDLLPRMKEELANVVTHA